MAGGLVAEWYRPDGTFVDVGEPVCRVESSFVAYEVEAAGPGVLRHRKPAGSIERPGAVVGLILAPGETIPAADTPREPDAGVEAEDATFEVPCQPGESLDSEADHGPDPEFEEALAEAVVVPFPRRFVASANEWGEAPGDAVGFETSLFRGAGDERAEALDVPGGSIPGLPMWEPEDTAAGSAAYLEPATDRFARIAAEATAAAQVLTMAVSLDTADAENLRRVCAREWPDGPAPLLEDVLFRAIALALCEAGVESPAGAMFLTGCDSDLSSAVSLPAGRPFREAVAARESGGDASFEAANWLLVSHAAQGLLSATPRLDHGRPFAFAVGGADPGGRMTLTMSYDSLGWGEGAAARLLARIRVLFEAPYAVLL